MSDYVPIACIDHEKLEFAVLRRQQLAIRFLDPQEKVVRLRLLPTDVVTRQGAEWLHYRDESGAVGVLRLDRILSAVSDP